MKKHFTACYFGRDIIVFYIIMVKLVLQFFSPKLQGSLLKKISKCHIHTEYDQ